MRKTALFLTLSFLILSPTTTYATTTESSLAPHAASAVLMDADTGAVIFAKNPHQRRPIASVTKLASLLLFMEALDKRQMHENDFVTTSSYAASMGGSQIFLKEGEKMSVHDLLKAIALASANDATVALAEHLAGTQDRFVAMMNQKSRTLGLEDTHFQNSNGLPAADHYASAYDLAQLSRALLAHKRITMYTSSYSDYIRKNTPKPFWLVNTNKLIRYYPGMDGLKTGYTKEAKYCLAATAKRQNLRFIAVVLGEPTAPIRNAEVAMLMNDGFSRFTKKPLYAKNQTVAMVPVSRGKWKAVAALTRADVGILTDKANGNPIVHYVVNWRPVAAPVFQGQKLGEVVGFIQKNRVVTYDLIAQTDVPKITWWLMIQRIFQDLIHFGSSAS